MYIHVNETIISVFSSSLNYYHSPEYALTSYVNGVQRNLFIDSLTETKEFRYGNYQDIKKDKVRIIMADDYAQNNLDCLFGST